MNQSKLDAAQLQRRDPVAWTALLRSQLGLDDVVVTAVSAEPLHIDSETKFRRRVTRYLLALADHTDPITFISKRTTLQETLFYQQIAPNLPGIVPYCWFTYLNEEYGYGWVVLDDVPNAITPEKWSVDDVEAVICALADLHAPFWNQGQELTSAGIPHFIGRKKYSWDELRAEQAVYFDQGPGAVLSEHAIHHAGGLAPRLLQAANGLVVLRDLGGWPGILSETHLAAAADLLDDPVPLLQPLHNLPLTLLHGNPHTYHWRLTLFGDNRLVDWRKAAVGPSVCDLVNFLEQFELLYENGDRQYRTVRQQWPVTEETMVDSYMLAMSHRLGSQYDARSIRLAIPATRCLHVLLNWFPHFANWFAEMPSKYTWQKVNRMSDEQLAGTIFQPIVRFRPYLSAVFQRFLRAYRSL